MAVAQAAAGAAASMMMGGGMMGMMGGGMMGGGMNFQQSGQAVGNAPLPGVLGGGGAPTDGGIATLSASLALLPVGANAVSVFPPFAT